MSNISAIAVSVPFENVAEKIKDIQSLRFYVESVEPTCNEKVKIVAKILQPEEDLQRFDAIDLEELKQKLRVLKESRRQPYVW